MLYCYSVWLKYIIYFSYHAKIFIYLYHVRDQNVLFSILYQQIKSKRTKVNGTRGRLETYRSQTA